MKSASIPACVQVVGLADCYDALRTMRSYRPALPHAAAAKGASAAGPYGAVAGALWESRHHAGKIAAIVVVLLLLPALFVLLLPSLIFGGLTSSGSDPGGQPVLNDNAAIIESSNEIAFTITLVLGEGIDDVKERIAHDFAKTGGGQYAVINPYAESILGNTNAIIGQYCAFRGQDLARIALVPIWSRRFGMVWSTSAPSRGPLRPAPFQMIRIPRPMRAEQRSGTTAPSHIKGRRISRATSSISPTSRRNLPTITRRISAYSWATEPSSTPAAPTASRLLGISVSQTEPLRCSSSTSRMTAMPTSPTARTTSADTAAAPPPWPSRSPPSQAI